MHFLLDGSRVELKGVTIATHPEGDPAIDGEHGQETNIDQAFLDAINKKDQSLVLSSYGDAMKTLAVTLAANESARTGMPVKVDLA